MSCEYCKGVERLYPANRPYDYLTVYDFGQCDIDIDDGEGTTLEFNINYCPMCGTKLGDSDD